MVQLSRKLKDKGLAVVSISFDYPDKEADVLGFLKQQGATFDNLISPHGPTEKSVEEFGGVGAVPFYQLFDRRGKLAYQFSAMPDDLVNGQPIERMDARIRELLADH
ncbi:MAG: TlpA disulfide reductase family protein [Pirellulales bacterium]